MSHESRPARRDFLGLSAAAIGGLSLSSCAGTSSRSTGPIVGARDVVLFQGDSITDAGRSRKRATEANVQPALGRGYAWLAAAGLLVDHGEGLKVFNRGISGHKVFQLARRWDRDCIDLKPDVLSILIGVNDIWHTRNGKYDGTVEIYERDYDALLARTREALPSIKLLICEPFVLRCGAVKDSWFPEFDHYRQAARRVADKHGAAWVPFQTVFDRAVDLAPPEHWAKDGVHPTGAGAALMAQTWLDVATQGGAA